MMSNMKVNKLINLIKMTKYNARRFVFNLFRKILIQYQRMSCYNIIRVLGHRQLLLRARVLLISYMCTAVVYISMQYYYYCASNFRV